ncbi:MAG: 1-deoxy-D-xylulose-5-phosphate reductoisomerase [Corallococcus sp.]|nr:1-deoxy-D-xylulose-5-phosphate reductoisomerase [Bacillota bacterium]MCM1534131.1 1-deoxy-D-xylulose-5-phosphate reductoisomerase [Corallococcus sp.]
MKKVAILGSTGSIGTQALDVMRRYPDKLKVHSLAAYSNTEKLAEQCREFSPQYSALISVDGEECLTAAVKSCDVALVATRGICALESILYCLDNGIDVALANKEALVCGGELIMSKLSESESKLFPVDSEHYAISQCLKGRDSNSLKKILLTASGGPFWEENKGDLRLISAARALRHPNWNMGAKITVDSATMMNKALEVIEACHLFNLDADKIQIVVHRQSIVHSMAEFVDGSVIAQMSLPDMRLPIQSALLGETGGAFVQNVDFERLLTLTFEKCDFDKFPCARLGYEIFDYAPLCATVMNSANDACVEKFLQGRLSFADFYNIITRTVERFQNQCKDFDVTVENIRKFDKLAEEYAKQLIDGDIC